MQSNNDFPRNPAIIHKIQDALMKLEVGKELSFVDPLSISIVAYRGAAIVPLVKILSGEATRDREKIKTLIGKETLKLIDEYMEGEKEQPENDLPKNLFQQ